MANDYKKPIPSPQGESDFYWEKAKQEELWLRECPVNGPYFYPRDISPGAMRKDTKWIKASGKATLFTFSIISDSCSSIEPSSSPISAIAAISSRLTFLTSSSSGVSLAERM